MFLIDNIVTTPIRGVIWLAEKINAAVEDENKRQAEAIMLQLTELHQLLEAEKISEDEFDEREQQLLDQLEQYEDNAG